MKAPMVVTDLTRMQRGNVCIGGYLRNYIGVRPVIPFKGLHETWLTIGHDVIRPFAVIELDFLHAKPEPPHTEDQAIHPIYRIYRQLLTPERRVRLLERIDDGTVQAIFGAMIHHEHGWYVHAGDGTRSLGTIQPAQIEEIRYHERAGSKWDYRIAFTDGADERYNLAVTDLTFRYFLDYRRTIIGESPAAIGRSLTQALQEARVFLRIGLTRGGHDPDRCHLQITGVHSFPDYLDGRCFANFRPPLEPIIHPVSDDDIPF